MSVKLIRTVLLRNTVFLFVRIGLSCPTKCCIKKVVRIKTKAQCVFNCMDILALISKEEAVFLFLKVLLNGTKNGSFASISLFPNSMTVMLTVCGVAEILRKKESIAIQKKKILNHLWNSHSSELSKEI